MAMLRLYRTYNFVNKDPVIDEVRTVLKDEGLIKRLGIVHELSGVSVSTLKNWFDGDTKKPQNPTIEAVLTSLGYVRKIEKLKAIDIEQERKIAAKWHEKHDNPKPAVARPRRKRKLMPLQPKRIRQQTNGKVLQAS